jgi:asparagine synthase (glutamine-hydrolysing)
MTIQNIFFLFKYLGPWWVLCRGWYAVKLKLGYFKLRTPARSWQQRPLATFITNPILRTAEDYFLYRRRHSPPFFFSPEQIKGFKTDFSLWNDEHTWPIKEAEDILDGVFVYFHHHKKGIGYPPDWFFDPFNHLKVPFKRHWSDIPDFGKGDIKIIWELSRFGFVYTLVRAYARSGDKKYGEAFWQLIESWYRVNPPNWGPNWKCSQEIALRVMAWCFGLYAFMDCNMTPDRLQWLVQLIAVSGERIEANINYALSQKNNHAVSEAAGLFTIGCLFPELKPAERWKRKGKILLQQCARELIYRDGAFAQHSMVYQRLVLQVYCWVVRLGELHRIPFSNALKERLYQSALLLYQLMQRETGQVPNYGHNDGSSVLPLHNCDYSDYRPVVQTVCRLVRGERCFQDGPWDEMLLWLGGEKAMSGPVETVERKDLCAQPGGYFTLRSVRGFAFARAVDYRHRPGQADQLHTDIWWKQQNIAIDAGTYSYHAAAPWNNPFATTLVHNTVTVDGRNQMNRTGKFLWLPWIKAGLRFQRRSARGHVGCLQLYHRGYETLSPAVFYDRSILQLGEDSFAVLDRLNSSARHSYRLHWLFNEFAWHFAEESQSLTVQTDQGNYFMRILATNTFAGSLVQTDPNSPRGWQSRYYYDKTPALSWAVESTCDSLIFCTLFSPWPLNPVWRENEIHIAAENLTGTIRLNEMTEKLMVKSIVLNGVVKDELIIA